MKLFEDLEKLEIKNDDVLLVHSSFKSLGDENLDPNLFLEAMMQYLNKGTLLFPSLSHKEVTSVRPNFNVKFTKSCVGYLSEVFRQNDKVKRSIHPTHSVCSIGKYAIDMIQNHELDNTPCGENSPFALLPTYQGKILMLGCGLKPNTSFHAIEEVFEPTYLYGETVSYNLTNYKGRTYRKEYRTHSFQGLAQRYDKIEKRNKDGWIKKGRILEAESIVLPAKKLWSEAQEVLRKDNFAFVENK